MAYRAVGAPLYSFHHTNLNNHLHFTSGFVYVCTCKMQVDLKTKFFMRKLTNETTINAPMEKVWEILANAALLDQYDPTVKKSTLISAHSSGPDAKRRVDMLDGKNWFEEKITEYDPGK